MPLPGSINFWVFIEDCGDGSALAHYFPTEEHAEDYANKSANYSGQRLCDDVYQDSIFLDCGGKVIPEMWEENDD